MPHPVLVVLIGGTTGFLAGMLGAGGGFATVALLLLVGLANDSAVGTSLLYTVVIGAWGTLVHLRQKTASWWLALALGVPSAITAVIAAEVHLSDTTFSFAFAAIAFAAAGAFMLDARRKPAVAPVSGAQVDAPLADVRPEPRLIAGAIAGGAAIGFLKGLFGVGGGFLLMPLMVVALRVPEKIAVGSSLFAILIGSIAGGIKHAMIGNVAWEAFWYLLPGGLIGTFIGAGVVKRVEAKVIRTSFVALLLVTAGYVTVRALL